MKETIAYLNSLLKDKDTIVIGLSGGSDSMCLLNIIMSLNKDIHIICAHINHNIREESKDEMHFIEDYCRNNKLELETTTFDKKSLEEDYNELELREKRYNFFEKVIKKYKADYLFTAHHGDDLIETILMRITRGSNLKGYTGFQIETDKGTYKSIKPLIFMTKQEIEEYVSKKDIPYVTDKTNYEDTYTRNRYRHNILPFLKKENSNVHLKYLKFSRELQKYYNFVNDIINKEIEKRYNKKVLNIQAFNKLDKLIQTKIIEYVLDDNYEDNLYLVNDKHVSLILDIINNPKPNIEINLPDKLRITKYYDKLKISRSTKRLEKYRIPITEKTDLPNGRTINIIKDTDKNTNDYIKLNSEELNLPLYVRNREVGDKMVVKNMNSPKKIKDIFINSKISKEERENQPIVVDSKGEIVWLPGLKKSKFDKAKNEKYDIILWYN